MLDAPGVTKLITILKDLIFSVCLLIWYVCVYVRALMYIMNACMFL